MKRMCRRCGGSGWLLRNPKYQTRLQEKRAGDSVWGKWLTPCTGTSGSNCPTKDRALIPKPE